MKHAYKWPGFNIYWPSWMFLVGMLVGCGGKQTAVIPAPCASFTPQPQPANATVVTLWAHSARWNCWNAYGPALGMQQTPEAHIYIDVDAYPVEMKIYYQQINDRFAIDEWPDLMLSSFGEMHHWRHLEYIHPITDCFALEPSLNAIWPESLAPATVAGEIWGMPFATDLQVLFYNKSLLRQLGWSDARIEALPTEIAEGAFTLQMLQQTAQSAIQQGIVEPGYGFWPTEHAHWQTNNYYIALGGQYYDEEIQKWTLEKDPLREAFAFSLSLYETNTTLESFADKSGLDWGDRLIRQDVVAANRVLFWLDSTRDVTHLWADHGFEETFHQEIGLAMIPSGQINQPPSIMFSQEYYVATQQAFATEAKATAVCKVLAGALSPEINALSAATSFRYGVTDDVKTHSAYATHPLQAQLLPMVGHLIYLPDDNTFSNGRYALYREVLPQVQSGELSVETAVQMVERGLVQRLGDQIVIR